jgi:hypothetical protein
VRDGKAECAQYVGVSYDVKCRPTKPFRAKIYFQSKRYHICTAPTARKAARTLNVVARMIPGRELNFLTASSAARSSSKPSNGADAVPSERDIRAKIDVIQRGSGPAGAVKYFGVSKQKDNHNSYRAHLRIHGKVKHLGYHPTGEAAARAYDAVARTIRGRKLNFPNASSAAAAALEHMPMPASAPTSASTLPTRAKRAMRQAGAPQHEVGHPGSEH